MSLVGSLEDLNLGDILQIVSLSRKSGVLSLRSQAGEGRIILREGRVCAASVKGEPEDLRGVLVGGDFISDAEFDDAVNRSRRSGVSLDDALCEKTLLAPDRIDNLRREHVERAVMQMFSWRYGEFNFEVGGEIDDRDAELLLPKGVNAEYLAMEATRLGDEEDQSIEIGSREQPSLDPEDSDFMFSGEENGTFGDLPPGRSPGARADAAHEMIGLTVARRFDAEIDAYGPVDDPTLPETEVTYSPVLEAGDPLDARVPLEANQAPLTTQAVPDASVDVERELVAPIDVASLSNDPPTPPWSRPSPLAGDAAPVRLIAIDPDLNALEWLKSVLVGSFSRIHIFQRAEAGVARIQQYLGRGELPLVLISSRVEPDPAGGTPDASGLAERLRLLAPRMPILVTVESPAAGHLKPAAADAVVERPSSEALANPAGWSALDVSGRELRAVLETFSRDSRSEPPTASGPALPASLGLERLVEASARLRDREATGEVLPLVLDFASHYFARVAIFSVRDDMAVGLAQRGLEESGGPGDDELREIVIRVEDVAWFRDAITSGRALRSSPSAASCALTDLLGRSQPCDVFVAPIVSGGAAAALLYGDVLHGGRPIADTSPVEILLHQAGVALDRALLSRAFEAS